MIPVIAPLPGEELSSDALAATAAAFGNVIQVHRDGRIEHDLRDVPEVFDPVPNTLAPPAASLATAAHRITRNCSSSNATFCHDRVIATVLQLQQWLGPHVLQVEYIWMTRLLPAGARRRAEGDRHPRRVLEHRAKGADVRRARRRRRSAAKRPSVSAAADLIIAIQDEERQELQRLAPEIPVVTAGVDFDVVADAAGSIDGRILFVASGNPRNCQGTDRLHAAGMAAHPSPRARRGARRRRQRR